MYQLNINVAQQKYPIYIQPKLIEDAGKKIQEIYKNKKIVVITDENVEELYGKEIQNNLKESGFDIKTIVIKPGEKSKSLEVLETVYNKVLDFGINRGDLIITFGGGVVGDLGGFVAATLLRGIQFVQIPTTLLAQIDSSIGGKVAVNLKKGKNLIGNFYHPKMVLIDPNLLKTLDMRYFHDGMAEVIKYGAISDQKLLNDLLYTYDTQEKLFTHIEQIIYQCCSIKKQIVEEDDQDKGKRMLLNFGHTIGHAIEKYFNYQKYTHGEAVAIGMHIITKNSEFLGITESGTTAFLKKVLNKFQLPYHVSIQNEKNLQESIRFDKKAKGDAMYIVLLKHIGKGMIKKISIEEISKYCKIV